MTDFTFSPADFNATEITVVANTSAAKQFFADRFGFGCVAVNVRKSAAPEFADRIEAAGFSFQ